MEYEVAISMLNECIECGFFCPECGYKFTCNRQEMHEVAIEALEKQVPKKPKNICNYSKRYRGGKCECGFFLTEHMHTYCPSCSQKVDWSDEE